MCTTEAATIIQAGGFIQGTGGFLGAQSAARSKEFQAQSAENQATILDIQAEETREQGEQEALRVRQDASKALATQIASTAGSGIDIGSATAIEVAESEVRVGVADELQTRRNTKKKVWALKTSAEAQRSTAKDLKRAAKIERFVAPLAFVAPVLTSQAQAQNIKKRGIQ